MHPTPSAGGAPAVSLVLAVARARTSFVVSQDRNGNARLFPWRLREKVGIASYREVLAVVLLVSASMSVRWTPEHMVCGLSALH